MRSTIREAFRLGSGLALVLGLAACDVSKLPAESDAQAEVTSERPEGWESLEDENSASRLYYQFVDERGRVRFVERLEEVPERSRVGVGFVKLDVPPPLNPGDAARAREMQIARTGGIQRVSTGAATSTEVILYSADWCGACRKAKRHLARRGVDYEERDVDDPAVAAELLKKTGSRSIPVIDVGGRVLTGFSAGSYDALIESA